MTDVNKVILSDWTFRSAGGPIVGFCHNELVMTVAARREHRRDAALERAVARRRQAVSRPR